MSDELPPHAKADAAACPGLRWGLFAFGWLNVALGTVGLFLPLMPTTVFLLIALWSFSKCSLRFHRWLYEHPLLGRTLRDWHRHRVIPLKAKIPALAMLGASLIYVVFFVEGHWSLPVLAAALLTGVAAFIVTRPSRAPSGEAAAL
jgi:uncharacterized membrane protein YbaN (DUF454 family)